MILSCQILEPFAASNIKIVWNKFEHWLQVGQAMILHISKEFYFILF